MLRIDRNKTIHITRGDYGEITVNFSNPLASNISVVLRVCPPNDVEHPILVTESVRPQEGDTAVTFKIYSGDTKNNVPASNSPLTYWYEIELDAYSSHQSTVVGYDTNGPKLFVVYPEGIQS